MSEPAGRPAAAPAVCVRHPDRPTALSCTRCGRPACPECLREASVGHQCVDCVREGGGEVRRGATTAGSRAAPGRRPLVLSTLLALNVLVFAVTVVQAGSPVDLGGSSLLVDWVLMPGAVAGGQWWRLVTSGFVHFGFLHIALNMLVLWLLGRQLEVVFGRARFTAVYLLSLLGGSAACMLGYPAGSIVGGASGAIFGLLGALLVIVVRQRLPLSTILPTILINVVISVAVPGISLLAHLGGFVVGAAATAILVYGPRTPRVQVAGLAGLGVLVLGLCVAGAARFF